MLAALAPALCLRWLFGGLALCLGGALASWVGLIGLAAGDADGALVAMVGRLAWLQGQGHFLLRHGTIRSLLARAISRCPRRPGVEASETHVIKFGSPLAPRPCGWDRSWWSRIAPIAAVEVASVMWVIGRQHAIESPDWPLTGGTGFGATFKP